jgi:hypothetical protein
MKVWKQIALAVGLLLSWAGVYWDGYNTGKLNAWRDATDMINAMVPALPIAPQMGAKPWADTVNGREYQIVKIEVYPDTLTGVTRTLEERFCDSTLILTPLGNGETR